MEASPTSLKRLKFGKLKVVRRSLLQRYEHQPFISCLAGFYSCRWKRYQRKRTEPGKCCCSMVKELKISTDLDFCTGAGHSNNSRSASLLAHVTTSHQDAYNVFLISQVLAMCLLAEGQQLYLHWSHKVGRVRAFWQSCALLCGLTLAFLLQILSVTQVIIVGPYLAILLFLFLIPLGMYSPCIREMGTLGPKPALIGHRGAPMLAPENTEMSFLKTIEHGGDGLETDVTISYDGVPFLMHDDTLRRTTNIQEVYPNDTGKAASFFSWDALQKLNAGTWFLKNKPFVGMGSLSKADQNQAMNQSIYTLSSFLRLADSHNKLVIFDLYRPPEKHPYRNLWIQFTGSSWCLQVLWLHNGVRSFVQSVAPGFQHTMGKKAPIEDLLKHNIVKLNLVYTDMSSEDIRKYAEANITTNFYVVNEPWLYSLAWCSGAHSVTTNAVHLLKDLSQPLFLMVSGSLLLKHLIDVRSLSFPRASHSPCQTWSCSTSPRETTTETSLPSGRNFHTISLFVILPWTICRAKKYLRHWSYQSLCKDFK
uniref:Glycerophosphodiester phosphodiesterase domain containing 4 n=1 Tax=Cyanoderma ruficeps TaxID=181631 RepID=A0A8C3R8J9_9PASS